MLAAAIVSSLDSDLSATVQKNPFPYICLSKDRMDAVAVISHDDSHAKVASLGHKKARRDWLWQSCTTAEYRRREEMRTSISVRQKGYLFQKDMVMMLGFSLVECSWHSSDNFGNKVVHGRRGEEKGEVQKYHEIHWLHGEIEGAFCV